MQPLVVERAATSSRRGTASTPSPPRRTAGRRGGRRSGSRHVPPLVGEAAAGAAARARAARPRRRADRDRLRVAPRPAASSSLPSDACSPPRRPTEDELECGPEPTPLEHNCSGKHAGFLALCRAHGWPSAGYRAGRTIRCQQALLAEVAAAADVDPAAIPTAADGCGVVTFALSLERMAAAFGALPRARWRRRRVAGDARAPGAAPRPARRRLAC